MIQWDRLIQQKRLTKDIRFDQISRVMFFAHAKARDGDTKLYLPH